MHIAFTDGMAQAFEDFCTENKLEIDCRSAGCGSASFYIDDEMILNRFREWVTGEIDRCILPEEDD